MKCSERSVYLHLLLTVLCLSCFYLFFFSDLFLPSYFRCTRLLSHLIRLTDTHTLVRTPLFEGSARRRDLYPTTHNTHKTQTGMLPADSNPQSQQGRSRSPKCYTAQPLGWTASLATCQLSSRKAEKHVMCPLLKSYLKRNLITI